jgi:4-hydroxy-3-polyprenylbenzoate decarboxylase
LAYRDLQSFINRLERARELKRVSVEVDPELEITEIVTRVCREEGPALLFERVKGSSFPLVINLFGSMRRIELALGRSPAELGQDLLRLAQSANPPKWLGLWKERRTIWRALKIRTARGRKGPSQQIVEEPALDQLPVLKCWPKDAGRFITYGIVLTQHPRTAVRNVGLYRLQVHSANTTGMHWQIQKGGGFHYAEAEKQGQSLPLAVVIGADPYLLMAAVAPLPEGMDEVAFSGFLRGAPMKMIPGTIIPIDVPAEAEFILEGEVPPQERVLEGPFGDHFGHYSHAAPYPVFQVRRVTRRHHPIYHATVVGKPPQEDKYLGDASQEVMGPLIRLIKPEVQDLWAYYEAGFHNLLVVSVTQRYGKEAMKSALGLLGEGQLSLTKCMILVDGGVNVRDFYAVLQAIGQNYDAAEDTLILAGVPMDTLDFTSYTMNLGSKMILDATRKPGKRATKRPPLPHTDFKFLTEEDSRILDFRLWENTLLVAQVRAESRMVLEKLVHDARLEGVKIIAVVSPDIDLHDRVDTLWGLFTRFDCARDVIFTETHLVGPVVRYKGRLGIDATFKNGYPEPLEMPRAVRDLVSERWKDYGL